MNRASVQSPVLEAILVLLGFGAVTLAFTYPLWRNLEASLPNDLGDPVLNAWILAWDAERIRHGLSGLWDAPNFFPYRSTLAYSDHLLGIAVFTAPLAWLTANPILVYNVAFLASFVTSGAAMYLLARTLTGRRDAAIVAGLVYAFTPFRVAHLAHLQWLTVGWLPLGLWAVHRYFATGAWRFLLTSAACFLMQTLTATYFAYFAIVPFGIVGMAEMRRARPPLRRTLVHLFSAGVLALTVLWPVARTYYDVRRTSGLSRSYELIASYGADVGDYLRVHRNVRIWPDPVFSSGERELMPGALAALLAAAAVIAYARKEAAVRMYAAIAATAFVLSLGPQPAAFGYRLPFPGPYGWLLAIIPGLDGIRVPARLALIVVLAVSVLAAFGARWLLDRILAKRQPLVVAAFAVVIVAEGWAVPLPAARFDPSGDPLDRDAYEYLRQSPPGAALELPISLTKNLEPEFRYEYLTLVHRHPVVNGQSGHSTPLLTFLGGDSSPFNELDRLDAAIQMVRHVGVKYIVVHPADFSDRTVAETLVRALENNRGQVLSTRRFERVVVFALAPPETVAPPTSRSAAVERLVRIPPSAIRPAASLAFERVTMALDGDADTRWLSGRRQEGTEWFELAFDRPRDVRLLRLQVAKRSFGDYPRELAIDVVENSGPRTVFQGSVLPQLGQGLVTAGEYPYMDFALPENHSRAVRLRQLATTNRYFWSIHEVEVWEARRP